MNYIKITKYDIANGPGVRVVLWVSGCRLHCYNCHNPETWDIDAGQIFDENAKKELFDALSKPYIQGITLSGGHPLEPENAPVIYILCKEIKKTFPDKDIWLYTGLLYEKIKENPILDFVDVVVDGPYIDEKRNISLKYRGSENQRVIDVKQTKKEGKIIELFPFSKKE